jgi:hypothetical protein
VAEKQAAEEVEEELDLPHNGGNGSPGEEGADPKKEMIAARRIARKVSRNQKVSRDMADR